MKRYFAEIAFDGTRYHGWQIQPNGITIQEEINNNLSLLLKEEISTIGAGRTDAGVHAEQFYFHFDYNHELPFKTNELVYKLNQLLPEDISVIRIMCVPDKMHARFDAISRTYQYRITHKKNPFEKRYSWYLPYSIDIGLMNECEIILKNNRDFTSFSKLHTDVKTNLCNIEHARWDYRNDMLIFEIKADRFLRNMVRAIVGTMIEIGKKKKTVTEFSEIIDKKNRNIAGQSAPACGLFLTKIVYSNKVLNFNEFEAFV